MQPDRRWKQDVLGASPWDKEDAAMPSPKGLGTAARRWSCDTASTEASLRRPSSSSTCSGSPTSLEDYSPAGVGAVLPEVEVPASVPAAWDRRRYGRRAARANEDQSTACGVEEEPLFLRLRAASPNLGSVAQFGTIGGAIAEVQQRHEVAEYWHNLRREAAGPGPRPAGASSAFGKYGLESVGDLNAAGEAEEDRHSMGAWGQLRHNLAALDSNTMMAHGPPPNTFQAQEDGVAWRVEDERLREQLYAMQLEMQRLMDGS